MSYAMCHQKSYFHLPQELLQTNVCRSLKKRGKKKSITSFHRKRIILMRKRRKLAKSHILVSEKTAQIFHAEELICDSYRQEAYMMKKLL